MISTQDPNVSSIAIGNNSSCVTENITAQGCWTEGVLSNIEHCWEWLDPTRTLSLHQLAVPCPVSTPIQQIHTGHKNKVDEVNAINKIKQLKLEEE